MPSSAVGLAPSSAAPRRPMIAVAGVALVAGAALAALTLWAFASTRRAPAASAPSVTRLMMGVEPAESLLGGPGTNVQARPTRTAIAWSPDGRAIVFGGGRGGSAQLYVRRLDQLQATPLAGTEGAVAPFFSPDGATVGFWAAGALKKVALSGGPAVTICEAPIVGHATWAEGDVIYFDASSLSRRTGIWSVPAGGGRSQPLAEPDPSKGEYSYRLPHALPGGKRCCSRWSAANSVGRMPKSS